MAFSAPGASNPFGSFGSTSTTNNSNLFGQPPASNPSFGAPAASAAPTSGTGLFGATSAASTGGGGGLFGSSSTAAAPAGGGGGLFGSTSNAGPTTGGGLFGSTSTPNLFGSTAAPTSSSTPASGGLFGSSAPGASAAPATGGLFGSTSTTGVSGGTALFGSTNASTNTTGGGLFGSKPATTGGFGTSTGGGLFGSGTAAPATGGFGSSTGGGTFGSTGAFGGSTLGQPNNQLVQSSGAQAQAGLALQKTSRFNDLPVEMKKDIESIDIYVQEESLIGDELKSRLFGSLISEGKTRLRDVTSDFNSLSSQLTTTSHALTSLRSSLDSSTTSFLRSSSIVDAYRSPSDRELATKAQKFVRFPFEWFERKVGEMEGRWKGLREGMENLGALVKGWNDRGNPAAIVPALRAQHATFISLASSIATLDLQLKALKEDYRELWRRQVGGSVRDPFEEAFLEGSGLGSGVEGMRI